MPSTITGRLVQGPHRRTAHVDQDGLAGMLDGVALGNQHGLEIVTTARSLHGRSELGQWERGADEALHVDAAVGQGPDRLGIAVGAQVAAVDVELLLVAYQVPVDRGWLIEHAEGDQRAQAPDHGEALLWGFGAARYLDVHVAAVSLRQALDPCHSVFFQWVDRKIGPELPRQLQAVVLGVQGDQLAGVVAPRRLQRAQADVAHARDDDGIARLDLATIDGMHGAGQRFDVGSLLL